ncbi:hypothetical protein D3C73_1605490 [compost metagenome]
MGEAGVGTEQDNHQCQRGGKHSKAKSRSGHGDVLADVGQLQQMAQVIEQVLALDPGVVAQHQVAMRIDNP